MTLDRQSLIALLGILSFSTAFAQLVVAPVLTEIGRDFAITPGVAGLAVAAFGVPALGRDHEERSTDRCFRPRRNGRELRGWVTTTVLRGSVVYRNGVIVGDPRGEYLFRPL